MAMSVLLCGIFVGVTPSAAGSVSATTSAAPAQIDLIDAVVQAPGDVRPRSPIETPVGATYYVSSAGNDSNTGTSADSPWRTLAKVNSRTLAAGQTVLLRRGDTFTDAGLVVNASGTATAPITIAAYGTGSLPIIDGGGTDTATGRRTPIAIYGNFVTVDSIQVQHAKYAGVDLFGTDATVTRCTATLNATGIQQNGSAARAHITLNSFVRNNILVIGPGSDDDYGAQGLALGGAGAEVSYNTFSGHYSTGSPDYGSDGAAIEIFGSKNADIHHNKSTDDLIFSELGNSATGTVFHHNVVYSTLPAAGGINVHGVGTYGGVTGTKVLHNTIVLTAVDSQIIVVDGTADCELKNNILVAAISYSEKPINESANVWTIAKYQGVNSTNATRSAGVATSSILTPNAGLKSPATGDFGLTSTSVAINRAVDASVAFAVDFNGAPKNGLSWDAGALEFS